MDDPMKGGMDDLPHGRTDGVMDGWMDVYMDDVVEGWMDKTWGALWMTMKSATQESPSRVRSEEGRFARDFGASQK